LNHGIFIPTGRILAGNWTRLTMYVLRNIEMSLCNHCCSGRAISITYSECVFVALVWSMNSACFVWHCHLRPVWLYHIFPRYHKGHETLKKSYWTQNVCFDSFYNFCLKHFSFWEEFSEIVL
jgi:hypothetical protein